jgi:hypothetical protein
MIKKIFTLLLFMSAGLFAFAQTVNITFEVNAANITVDANGLYLAGGTGFGRPGDNPMSDSDNDGIWTVTITKPLNFSSHYTFLNGNCGDWSCKENISGQACADAANFNDRFLPRVTQDTTIKTCFGECSTDGSCSAPDTREFAALPISWDENQDDVNFNLTSFDGAVATIVESPTETGNMVLKVEKPSTAQQWAGTILGSDGLSAVIPFDANNNNLVARVWSAKSGTNVMLKIENADNGGIFVETQAVTTKDGEWEDLVFDYTNPGPNTNPINYANDYNKIVIFFNFLQDQGSDDLTFYLDDVQFGDEIVKEASDPMVTFQVDMNNYTEAYTTVNLNGTFNGWCGSCAVMTDDNSDGVYELTVELPAGDIEYKFTVDGWDGQENFAGGEDCTKSADGFTNRAYTVAGDATLDVVCWESCDACGDAPTMVDVTFQVDMNSFEGDAYTKVNLNGTFNDWCGECAEMIDENADGIYELTVSLAEGEEVDYKFTLDGWTQQEEFTEGDACTTTKDGFTNRSYTPAEGGATLEAVCYNSCEACATGFGEFDVNAFSISPNPSNGVITINFTEQMDGNVVIYDYQGREVFSNLNSVLTTKTIDLSNEPAGIYLIKVSGNEKVGYKQIILE